MHSCQACNDGNIWRATMGPVCDMAPLLEGTRFHLDFGLVCDSSADFGFPFGS
jgi:hypothetical protein